MEASFLVYLVRLAGEYQKRVDLFNSPPTASLDWRVADLLWLILPMILMC